MAVKMVTKLVKGLATVDNTPVAFENLLAGT